MARVIYRVAPSGSNWVVMREGVVQSDHSEKLQAVEAGGAAARREWELFKRAAECVVHRGDGSVENEWDYG